MTRPHQSLRTPPSTPSPTPSPTPPSRPPSCALTRAPAQAPAYALADPQALIETCAVLVFDLDGTLIDTAPDIRGTLSLALQACGLAGLAPGCNPPDMHSPLRGIVLAQLAAGAQDPALADRVVQAYRQQHALQQHRGSRLYAGVPEFLRTRRELGCRMAICTNKGERDALVVLEHFGLQDFFSHVVGADSAAHAKPDPAPLRLALALLRAEPADALLIGDSHLDALCAQRAGVGFVWHHAGYGGDEVRGHPMRASFGAFAELWQRAKLPVGAAGKVPAAGSSGV